jgi:hypothetical protein
MVPDGYYQDTKVQIIEDVSKGVGGDEEGQWDYWSNRLWPMTKVKQMWQEKWLAKEENGSSGDSSREEEIEVTLDKGGSNPESGNGNSGSGNGNPGEEEHR